MVYTESLIDMWFNVEVRSHPVQVKWVVTNHNGKITGNYGLVYPNRKDPT
jgi:hypothetical protein